MIYLALAIISSALISILMRCGERKIKNNMAMFLLNYIVCGGLSFLFMDRRQLSWAGEGLTVDAGLGVISGVLYLVSFVLLQLNIRKNGVVLASTFMKLGVLIPTLMAIIVFHETPKVINIIGIALAIAAIIAMYYEKDESGTAKVRLLLVLILLASGVTDSMANIYDKSGAAGSKDRYLLIVFGTAALCSLLLMLKKKQRVTAWDALFGAIIGLPNYFSSRFLLQSLHQLPATIVYPTFSVMTIVLVAAAGIVLFKEKLNRRKLISIVMIFAALALLNL